MSMIKIVSPHGWDWNQPIANVVKVSRDGLIGQDRSDFIKIASPVFLELIDKIKVAKDEVPVHLIALGASEAYGPNRNGDGFKEATCKSYYKTFEKYARWYRNHQNKDPQKSYGYIKAAAYNDAMRRVELLVMLNASKQAAERNGGFIADRELEKLAKGEDIPVSMACRVPFDVCSSCKHQARTRDEYCTEDSCVGPHGEKRGGCRHNLTKVGEDGHVLHVDNPDPLWFDISNVFRPADRIAYGSRADYLQKAASDVFVPGAELAANLGVTAPIHVILSQQGENPWNIAVAGQMKLACGLACTEQMGHQLPGDTLRAFLPCVQPDMPDHVFDTLGRPGSTKAAEALGALADEKIILPLSVFAAWLGKKAHVALAGDLLPGVFTRLAERDDLEQLLTANPYAVSEKQASSTQRMLARNLAPAFSLSVDSVRERAMRSVLKQASAPVSKTSFGNEKQAASDPEAVRLAEAYAMYKIAALHRIAAFDREFHLTTRLAIGQNHV